MILISGLMWGPGAMSGKNQARALVQPAALQTESLQHSGDIELGTTLVNTFVTVTDKGGRFISDLNASDFVISDEGRRQQISEFSRETQLPLTLALVVDRSRSVQTRFELERAAAIQFLESVLRKGQDQGLLMAFDSDVYLVHDFTDDAAALSRQIKNLTAAGNSAIFDAVYKTARNKFSRIPFGRKVMVLITDGEDTASEMTLQQAIDMALRTDVIVYPISIRVSKEGASALSQLAERTGGRALFLGDEHPQLAELFAHLQEELRNQYSIGYQMNQPPDGRFHRLKIRAKKRGLSVRARQGYYALPKPQKARGPLTQ
ncbi:MAG: VWA domain-containing protein [Acidobacteria bacterium]|nr:VWA domain-containing protein [Acidobacteriota bacterium]